MRAGAFSDEEIVHVEGEVDPPRDLEIIHDELRLKDLEYIRKNLDNLERSVVRGGGDKKKKEEFVRNDSFYVFVYLVLMSYTEWLMIPARPNLICCF